MLISIVPITNGSIIKDDDIDISISAGLFGFDIGNGIKIKIKNFENSDFIAYINITYDSVFGNKIDRSNRNYSILPDSEWATYILIGPRALFNQVEISVEVGDAFAGREGFSIGSFLILYK